MSDNKRQKNMVKSVLNCKNVLALHNGNVIKNVVIVKK
jgi:hypothetical protein